MHQWENPNNRGTARMHELENPKQGQGPYANDDHDNRDKARMQMTVNSGKARMHKWENPKSRGKARMSIWQCRCDDVDVQCTVRRKARMHKWGANDDHGDRGKARMQMTKANRGKACMQMTINDQQGQGPYTQMGKSKQQGQGQDPYATKTARAKPVCLYGHAHATVTM